MATCERSRAHAHGTGSRDTRPTSPQSKKPLRRMSTGIGLEMRARHAEAALRHDSHAFSGTATESTPRSTPSARWTRLAPNKLRGWKFGVRDVGTHCASERGR